VPTSPTIDKKSKSATRKDVPWNVVVLDDPVNLMAYVTMVLKRVFGYNQARAEILMMEVHQQGCFVVWTGTREKAEFFVQQLHSFQLRATMEKSE